MSELSVIYALSTFEWESLNKLTAPGDRTKHLSSEMSNAFLPSVWGQRAGLYVLRLVGGAHKRKKRNSAALLLKRRT